VLIVMKSTKAHANILFGVIWLRKIILVT
jgi:hypothetical protein